MTAMTCSAATVWPWTASRREHEAGERRADGDARAAALGPRPRACPNAASVCRAAATSASSAAASAAAAATSCPEASDFASRLREPIGVEPRHLGARGRGRRERGRARAPARAIRARRSSARPSRDRLPSRSRRRSGRGRAPRAAPSDRDRRRSRPVRSTVAGQAVGAGRRHLDAGRAHHLGPRRTFVGSSSCAPTRPRWGSRRRRGARVGRRRGRGLVAGASLRRRACRAPPCGSSRRRPGQRPRDSLAVFMARLPSRRASGRPTTRRQLDPGERAPQAGLDVGLQELDQAPLPLQPLAQRELAGGDRLAQRRQIGARPGQEVAGEQRRRRRSAPGRRRRARATSSRTRRRTSSSELSAARICASVSAISPARVRPTGDGSGIGNDRPTPMMRSLISPRSTNAESVGFGTRSRRTRASRRSSTWRSISAAATSPRSASACSSERAGGIAAERPRPAARSGRASRRGVHVQQHGERGARVRSAPLRLERGSGRCAPPRRARRPLRRRRAAPPWRARRRTRPAPRPSSPARSRSAPPPAAASAS